MYHHRHQWNIIVAIAKGKQITAATYLSGARKKMNTQTPQQLCNFHLVLHCQAMSWSPWKPAKRLRHYPKGLPRADFILCRLLGLDIGRELRRQDYSPSLELDRNLPNLKPLAWAHHKI